MHKIWTSCATFRRPLTLKHQAIYLKRWCLNLIENRYVVWWNPFGFGLELQLYKYIEIFNASIEHLVLVLADKRYLFTHSIFEFRIRTNGWEWVWQEPDLADVDVPGVAVICGHDDVLGVLRGEPRDQARVEETHLFLTKQNNFFTPRQSLGSDSMTHSMIAL